MAVPTPQTIFTRDILGNYVCNTFVAAQASGPFLNGVVSGLLDKEIASELGITERTVKAHRP
jgi:hypothetical protein